MSAVLHHSFRRIWLRNAFALGLLGSPWSASAAPPIQAGDVLVSLGNLILRIDPETGDDTLFSPPPLTLGNRLGPEGTDQIAIDPGGAIFAVSDGQVIEIDPVTGWQSLVQQRVKNCSFPLICGYTESALPLGSHPRGIDLVGDPIYSLGDRPDLLVGCDDAVYRVVRDGGEVSSSEAVFDIGNYIQLKGPLVVSLGFGMLVADDDLHETAPPPALSIFPGLGAPGTVKGLDSEGGVVVIAVSGGTDSPVAGVWYAGSGGFVPLTQGGYLRRPAGVAVDPLRLDRIWVTDLGSDAAPANRVIRLDYDGVAWKQTIVAELPNTSEIHGIAVSPVSFAPEPGAYFEALAALATVGVARRRRRPGT